MSCYNQRRLLLENSVFIFTQSINKRLHEVRLRARQLVSGIPLSTRQKDGCLAWCPRCRNYTNEWYLVLFTERIPLAVVYELMTTTDEHGGFQGVDTCQNHSVSTPFIMI